MIKKRKSKKDAISAAKMVIIRNLSYETFYLKMRKAMHYVTLYEV